MTVETYDMTPTGIRFSAHLCGLPDVDYRGIAMQDLGGGKITLTAGASNPGGEKFLAIMIQRGWARRMPD